MIIIGYIVAPFVNILLMRLFVNVPFRVILSHLFAAYGVLATVWLVTTPIVGISLYFVSRFSWYLMLGHSSLILLDFIIKWASRPTYYLRTVPGVQNLLILVGNVALVVFVAFIIQRDFRTPYFQVLTRGWRERKRIPMTYPVNLGGQARIASDLSTSGCFVVDEGTNRAPGSRVRLSLPVNASRVDCTGQVMRATREGLGIRFLDLTADEKRDIGRMLKKRFAPDRKIDLPGSPEPARF
ncbi:MAG: PilZ domain-containing protein [Spirochaetes bacterium]|nr:PilZ domain-containing protein [Spirochaetota bacterium]